jgi:hypothetical protein
MMTPVGDSAESGSTMTVRVEVEVRPRFAGAAAWPVVASAQPPAAPVWVEYLLCSQ